MFVHDNKSFFKANSFTMETINGMKVISLWSVFKVFFITNKLIGVKKTSHCCESILAIVFIKFFFFMCTFFLKILQISDMVIKQVGSTSKNYYRRKATITSAWTTGNPITQYQRFIIIDAKKRHTLKTTKKGYWQKCIKNIVKHSSWSFLQKLPRA